MKKLQKLGIFAALLSAFFSCIPSQATEVSYNFTATINDLFTYDASTGTTTNVSSSTFPGALVSIGNTITGSFSYDTGSPLSTYQPSAPASGSEQMYNDIGANSGIQFSIVQSGLSFTSFNTPFANSLIEVANNASDLFGADVFGFSGGAAYNPVMSQVASILLDDFTGTAFQSSAIPNSLSLASFTNADLTGGWLLESSGDQLGFDATITSLTPSGVVPEPATYAMMLAGLAMLGFMNHRKPQV